MKNLFAAFIPMAVPNGLFLTAYDLLRRWKGTAGRTARFRNTFTEQEAKQHYLHNRTILHKEKLLLPDNAYIEKQSAFQAVLFGRFRGENGLQNLAYSGCEVIAMYNVYVALGLAANADLLAELIWYFERDGIVANGRYGVSPKALRRYLSKVGFTYRYTTEFMSLTLQDYERHSAVYVATVYNDSKDIRAQIHTVCISKETDGCFYIHNGGKRGCSYPSLEEAIYHISQNVKPIQLIGIWKTGEVIRGIREIIYGSGQKQCPGTFSSNEF